MAEVSPERVERLRKLLRQAAPLLARQGWSRQDVDEVADGIRVAINERDRSRLDAFVKWMEQKVYPPRACTGVVPVLSDAAEARAADREWKGRKG